LFSNKDDQRRKVCAAKAQIGPVQDAVASVAKEGEKEGVDVAVEEGGEKQIAVVYSVEAEGEKQIVVAAVEGGGSEWSSRAEKSGLVYSTITAKQAAKFVPCNQTLIVRH
jgi:hypothetical protein